MSARAYYLDVQAVIHAAPHVLRSEISFDEIDATECYIRGTLSLLGDMELHIAEYVKTEPDFERLKYRYHLQTAEVGVLVSRWDNVAHYPQLHTLPITVMTPVAEYSHPNRWIFLRCWMRC